MCGECHVRVCKSVFTYIPPYIPRILGLLCRYVDVQAFNLQGPVPSSLTTLSQLSTLILGGNPGITNLPSNLKSLTKLTYVVARSRSPTRSRKCTSSCITTTSVT